MSNFLPGYIKAFLALFRGEPSSAATDEWSARPLVDDVRWRAILASCCERAGVQVVDIVYTPKSNKVLLRCEFGDRVVDVYRSQWATEEAIEQQLWALVTDWTGVRHG